MSRKFCLSFECSGFTEEKSGKEPRFIVEGFASTDLLDVVDDIITLGALKAAKDDLLKNNTVFLNHDREDIVGSTIGTEFIDGKGIKIRVLISNTREDIQKLVRENALNKFSIGGIVLESKKGRHPQTKKEINFITRIKLHEVSLVSLPANQDARSLSWSLEKGASQRRKQGGDSNRMGKKNAEGQEIDDEGNVIEPTPEPATEPEVQTGFGFDEDSLAEVAEKATAQAKGVAAIAQLNHLCGLLENGPDEEVAKIGGKIKSLIGELQGKSPESSKGLTAEDVKSMVKEAMVDVLADKALGGGAAPAKGGKAPVVRTGARKDAPGAGDPLPAAKSAEEALKAEFEALPKDSAIRMKWLADRGQLLKPASEMGR